METGRPATATAYGEACMRREVWCRGGRIPVYFPAVFVHAGGEIRDGYKVRSCVCGDSSGAPASTVQARRRQLHDAATQLGRRAGD
jgi:hypothetical protein